LCVLGKWNDVAYTRSSGGKARGKNSSREGAELSNWPCDKLSAIFPGPNIQKTHKKKNKKKKPPQTPPPKPKKKKTNRAEPPCVSIALSSVFRGRGEQETAGEEKGKQQREEKETGLRQEVSG